MTSPNSMVTECPCCGRCFETLAGLLEHMKLKHTEREILTCMSKTQTSMKASVA